MAICGLLQHNTEGHKKTRKKTALEIGMPNPYGVTEVYIIFFTFFSLLCLFFNKTEDHMTERREEEPPSSYLTAWVASFKLLKHHHGCSTMGAFIIYLEGGL